MTYDQWLTTDRDDPIRDAERAPECPPTAMAQDDTARFRAWIRRAHGWRTYLTTDGSTLTVLGRSDVLRWHLYSDGRGDHWRGDTRAASKMVEQWNERRVG